MKVEVSRYTSDENKPVIVLNGTFESEQELLLWHLKCIEEKINHVEKVEVVVKEEATTFDFMDGKGFVPAKRHKNPNGKIGGWVANTAQVDPTAFVTENAVVFGNAYVGGKASVLRESRVYGSAQIRENACVTDNAHVYGESMVHGNALICENAQVYGGAKVSENAIVQGRSKVFGNAQVLGRADISDFAKIGANSIIYGTSRVGGTFESKQDQVLRDCTYLQCL